MLDCAGAQRQLGVSRATLVRWLRDGRITGYKAGKQWRFRSEDLNLILRDGQLAYGTQTGVESTRALVAAGLPTPALLLADCRLADGWTGVEAVRWLRERLGTPVPAILLSGDISEDNSAAIRASGLRLIHKPVPPPVLRRILQDYC